MVGVGMKLPAGGVGSVSDLTVSRGTSGPRWARICLLSAALQCLVWGPFIILAPAASALAYGFSRPIADEFLWQGMGLVILLYGLGYAVAAFDPCRHYAVVLVGLLAKILGPVGMAWAVGQGQVSSNVLWLIPIHDMIWWWPFAVIVLRGRKLRVSQ